MRSEQLVSIQRKNRMSTSLFRPEALQHRRDALLGTATLAPPVSLVFGTLLLGASIVALITFLASSTYARKEHVQGYLAPAQAVAAIKAPRRGTIVAVHVTEGEIVVAGAPLATLSNEQTSDRGDDLDSAELDSLRLQVTHLREQIDFERQRRDLDVMRLRDAIAGLDTTIATLRQEAGLQTTRAAVARDQVVRAAMLAARGDVSDVEMKRRQDVLLSQMQGSIALARQIAEREAEQRRTSNELAQLPLSAGQREAQLRGAIADLTLRIAQTEAQRGTLITAPRAGRVSALQAHSGRVAEPSMPLLSLVPVDSPLHAELLVPARAIGLVAPGQPVMLGYDSFPVQRFGSVQGTVDTVSRTLLKPEDMAGPAAAREPGYIVSVTLPRQTISASGSDIALQPDMQLQADIIFDRRTLLGWLVEPFATAWRKAR
jgi:membrane fusion protein